MKKIIILLSIAALSGCQSTRTEMFQGEPIPLKPNEVLVKTRHEHNLEIWLKSQSRIKGVVAFKNVGPCPDPMGH